eukprot:SAG31_NODE_2497_length_5598_cov_3.904710_3_plen_94_part_00
MNLRRDQLPAIAPPSRTAMDSGAGEGMPDEATRQRVATNMIDAVIEVAGGGSGSGANARLQEQVSPEQYAAWVQQVHDAMAESGASTGNDTII